MSTYDRRFLRFQLSKYVAGAAAVALLALVVACKEHAWFAAAGAGTVGVLFAVAAWRMAAQYRCTNPACNQLLVLAHGSAASGGQHTHVRTCPYCAASLGE